MEGDGPEGHYSRRDQHYGYNGRGATPVENGDEGAVHISHRLSGINFTPTLHDSLVNEIRKLRNRLDKRENEVKILNEELGMSRIVLM
jgi:hypothetical protein